MIRLPWKQDKKLRDDPLFPFMPLPFYPHTKCKVIWGDFWYMLCLLSWNHVATIESN